MKTLIEDCFTITTKRFRKALRQAIRQGKSVNGYINIKLGNNESQADYRVESGTEYDYLMIRNAGTEQKIKLIDSELHFGPRIWFICECGARVAKLCLPPGNKEFKCRKCHKLCYQSSNINKKSKHGAFIYKNSLILKIMAMRENMGYIFYRSKYTKRFNHWLDLCDKAGLTDERVNADNLTADINR